MSSQPSTKMVGKGADGHTVAHCTEGCKTVKVVHLGSMLAPVDIHKAPVSRVYTKDYGKIQEKDDNDMVSPFLGPPLRW